MDRAGAKPNEVLGPRRRRGQVLRAHIGLLLRMPPESCPRGAVDAQMRGQLPHGVPGASRAAPHAIFSVQVIIQDKNLDSFVI